MATHTAHTCTQQSLSSVDCYQPRNMLRNVRYAASIWFCGGHWTEITCVISTIGLRHVQYW
eukprot:1181278-Rhodomonas_salina.4